MDYVCHEVPFSLIDWMDQTFTLRQFRASDRMEKSLSQFGVLTPPWLKEKTGGGFVIVDGRKRLNWLREKGLARTRCIVSPEDAETSLLLVHRIETRLFGPPLNVAEKADIIFRLSSILSPIQIVSRFFPLLGVNGPPQAVEKWRQLAAAKEVLLEAAAREVISERAVMELLECTGEAQKRLLNLLTLLRASASIEMEILERLKEISRRENEAITSIIGRPELAQILSDKEKNHRQKTQAVRDLLNRWRYPRLKEREERFHKEIAEASLPASMRLIPPPAFEGERWNLQIGFTSSSELQSLLKGAESFAASERLERLLERKTRS